MDSSLPADVQYRPRKTLDNISSVFLCGTYYHWINNQQSDQAHMDHWVTGIDLLPGVLMNTLAILFALLPILVILILLVWRRTPADIAGVVGWICALLIAWLYFKTPLVNTLLISLTGVVASLPITILVATSLLQITIMKEAGAIGRVVAFIKTPSPRAIKSPKS